MTNNSKFNMEYYAQQEAIRKAAHAITGNAAVQVIFFSPTDINQTPKTTGKKIYLKRPGIMWSKDEERQWWGESLHEIGHGDKNCKEDFQIAKDEEIDMTSLPGFVLNAVADYGDENNRYGEFYGRDSILSWMEGNICNKSREIFLKEHKEEFERIKGLRMFDLKCREKWQPDIIGEQDYLYKNLSTIAKETYDKLIEKHQKDYHNSSPLQGGHSTQRLDISKKIFETMFPELAWEEEKKKGKGPGKEGEMSKEEMELMDSMSPDSHGDQQEFASSLEQQTKLDNDTKGEYDWKYKGKGYSGEGDYIPYPSHRNMIIDYENHKIINKYDLGMYGNISTTDPTRFSLETLRKEMSFSVNMSHSFKRKLRRLLQIESQAAHIYSQPKGKLHGKNLFKVLIKEASYEYRRKVFKQKREKDILDVSVTIECDFSGSMGGSKVACAGAALITLHQLLSSLRIPYEILGFTEIEPCLISYIFKSFDKKIHTEQLKDRMRIAMGHMLQNADGDSILWAWSRLVKRPTKRKLLIVLSDGSPATDNPGDPATFTKKVTKQIEQDKRVELYGIGIEDSSVKRFYKDYTVINYADQIEKALLTVLSTKILRRN